MSSTPAPQLPIPISHITNRYLIFDISTVTWLRREHHICGVLIGTMPQAPQQNIFTGLPLEVMPEEARLLVERGVAYILDDTKVHMSAIRDLKEEDRKRYLSRLEGESRQFSKVMTDRKQQQREKMLRKQRERSSGSSSSALGNSSSSPSEITTSALTPPTLSLTPATSQFFIQPPPPPPLPPSSSSSTSTSSVPDSVPVPPSYPLYAHLHDKGYFLAPGLRFGCQYLVYPGDPLRFHSHFLGVGMGWDEEIDLMDLVGGGRLGTGVKKGFLIGGLEEEEDGSIGAEGEERKDQNQDRDGGEGSGKGKGPGSVRTWSIEWAIM